MDERGESWLVAVKDNHSLSSAPAPREEQISGVALEGDGIIAAWRQAHSLLIEENISGRLLVPL